jgi:hypothetical protein
VLNGGVSASWMNDEGLLANGVSATEEAKQLLDGIVSSMMEGEKDRGLLRKGVSATERIVETSAGRSCFGNGKMAGVEGMKNAEQWCFSIGKTDERLLVIGVSATGGEMEGCWCFSNGKREDETSAGRSCFGDKNDGGMADWNVLGMGRNGKCRTKVFQHREESHQCSSAVFQHREKSTVLHSGVAAS